MQIISGVLPKAVKAVVYGPEGIGKTTFASLAPDPLFIDTEGSTTRLDVKRLPAPTSVSMIMEEIFYVRNNPGICQTLVLDTADWAERMCRDNVCATHSVNGLEDFGYGKGYSYVYESFGKILNALNEVAERGIHVIVTAHAAMRKFEEPNENGSYDRWELKLINSPKCSVANMVKEWADMVLFANYETIVVKNEEKKNKAQGGRRVMYTAHHPCWDAKNRFGLAEKLPFDFAQVAHCFQMPVSAPAVPAPSQQASVVNPQMAGSSSTSIQPTSHSEQKDVSGPPAGIPQALWDLMCNSGVTEDQIRKVVSKRGYYPEDTPIANYDPAFVSGVLIGAWAQVHQMIKESN